MAPCEKEELPLAESAALCEDEAKSNGGYCDWRNAAFAEKLVDVFQDQEEPEEAPQTPSKDKAGHSWIDDEDEEDTCDEVSFSAMAAESLRWPAANEKAFDSTKFIDEVPPAEEQGWESQSLDSVSSGVSFGSTFTLDMNDMNEFHSPEETIIILDWDDTICPTTALSREVGLEAALEGHCKAGIDELTMEAKLAIEKCREVASEVIIVTNGVAGWVEASCERWLPDLRATLDTLEYTSARSTWQPMGISTPTGWKVAAFEEILRKFYSRYNGQSWKNVIVIGDGCYEHEALSFVTGSAPPGRCRAKSIRFATQPSVSTLTRELQMLRESLDSIVQHDDNMDQNFMAESL